MGRNSEQESQWDNGHTKPLPFDGTFATDLLSDKFLAKNIERET